ncbi:MAG: alginate O-acetyltransferase [Planctomycetota bacterium]|nr:MAG: alginate O-acetyltransferase [Planctomycetota bacterium]
MAFHTWQFGVFLAIVLGLFWLIAGHRNARSVLLLAASYVFYGSWEPWFLLLIVFSTVLDYHCAQWMEASTTKSRRKAVLLLSLAGNLGLLAYFKYSLWTVELLEPVLPEDGAGAALRTAAWSAVVPVGISFYTFQTLSYTIDVYRGTLKPARNLLDFALFVSFFPQLVAGPIVRASSFLPQLEWKPRFDRARLHDGLYRIGTGLMKKALIADTLALYLVDPVHNSPGEWAAWVHVLATFGFSFQIYFDFSGYSDIAIGTARLFGFDLPENFLQPMQSKSIREFWRRWHTTLSFWVRDYVYFPLGGSKASEPRVVFNLIVTMVIIGLWHGASVLWLLYGLFQGIAMALERWFERLRGGKQFATTPFKKALSFVFTLSFVSFTLLAVRGESFESVAAVLTEFGEGNELPIWAWLAIAASILTHYQPAKFYAGFTKRLLALPTVVQGVLMGLVIGVLIFVMSSSNAFIYFQF